MTKPVRRTFESSAIELVEESVHLLRRAPLTTLLMYYVGAVPFALGLLFYWAHLTWFFPSGEVVAWGALGLVAMFVAMKVAQAEFCARLLALRLGGEAPAWSWRRLGQVAIAQARLQSWTLVAWIPAALLTIPFGWFYAYAQNVTVLGHGDRLHADAVEQAKLWPRQNHLALLVMSAVAFGAWINIATGFGIVPWLANRLLGIENIFGFSGWWYLNTTFLASVSVLTWLAVDPLVKAFYTLRIFYGRARTTGEDLRVELQLARRMERALRAAAIVAILGLAFAVEMRAEDASAAIPPAAAPAPAVEPAPLNQAIEDVLRGPDFSWRLRPIPGEATAAPEGPLKRFVRRGVEMIKEAAEAVGKWIKGIVDWLERRFSSKEPAWQPREKSSGGASLPVLRLLLYVLIGLAIAGLVWVIWLMVRHGRTSGPAALQATAVAATPAPDLHDENVQAAQLPADGWLALAREQAARGELRLALRALYLATLARLAADGLVSLAKFKTNLDYERELRRRALSRTEIVAQFTRRRRVFEDVWYGRAEPGESVVRNWMAELDRPATP